MKSRIGLALLILAALSSAIAFGTLGGATLAAQPLSDAEMHTVIGGCAYYCCDPDGGTCVCSVLGAPCLANGAGDACLHPGAVCSDHEGSADEGKCKETGSTANCSLGTPTVCVEVDDAHFCRTAHGAGTPGCFCDPTRPESCECGQKVVCTGTGC